VIAKQRWLNKSKLVLRGQWVTQVEPDGSSDGGLRH